MDEIDLDSIRSAMRDQDEELGQNFDLTYEQLKLESDSNTQDYSLEKR